ncbi:MAG: hypothetical protein A2261_00335 [Candidatus Magasanikbacteria bacterium RIFOXYA2_FULL_44_8]|uniref:Uncharacterized protein n=1 Tax=Candidatus Magasanikbacteria bacterium RIFOXYA2_FULL_44_8 TaxID=1798696 RepID=A0A1F6NM58_9BACT|nr:MAG: hypothetical protein A2261_00335 [Candidatus Magasanikbacteria bacterium RIFOXYA2_FULL_44_8]
MNKNDSERIAGLLSAMGKEPVEKSQDADIIIVNTCSVRQTAEERIFGLFENWKKYRIAKPHLITVITGCMAGRDRDGKIRARMSEVDLFFGIDELPKLPEWIAEKWGEENIAGRMEDYLLIAPLRANKFQNFVTIQTGCENFCTYCVVPYARGRERNRPVVEILREIEMAVAGGSKEITLLGQVVNHYIAPDPGCFSVANPFVIPTEPHGRVEGSLGVLNLRDSSTTLGMTACDHFAALLWEINEIPGEFRIHYTAPDPQYFNEHQIDSLSLPKQVNFLHLPVQSVDNDVLKKMNRKYTREYYIDLIKKIRFARPEIALGTDIIVGFCGETDEQFQNTFDLFKQCDFDISYHAMYSERSGTAAAKAFKDDVPPAIKKERWNILQKYMEERVLAKNQKYLGTTVRVLVDKCANGICAGNSDEMKLVQFAGTPEMVGTFQKIKITQPMAWVMRGVLSGSL